MRSHFRRNGVEVLSDWLDLDFTLHYTPEQLHEEALKDLKAIDECDVFILYNPVMTHRKGTGGRHLEMGYALARGKHIIVVGETRENVFQSLKEVAFLTWDYNHHMNMLADAVMLILREPHYAELRQGSGTV